MEVIISLLLFSILASFLFSLFTGLSTMNGNLRRSKEEREALSITRAHLIKTLSKAHLNKESGHLFYTKEGVLFFTFDNGIDQDPPFSGLIRAELKIQNNDVVLEEKAMGHNLRRQFVLMKNVKSLSFSFLGEELSPSWDQDELPFMVKISVEKENEDYHFCLSFLEKEPLI